MNVITGLPRSGSTLLVNILNQNPDNKASNTSILDRIVKSLSTVISEQPETQDIDYGKIKKSIKAFINEWSDGNYDKGRLWSQMGLIYQDLGLGRMYVMVRDVRDVYASCEKQHRQTPLVAPSHIISSEGVRERAEMMCMPDGLIGAPVAGVEDLIRRGLPNVTFIQYEALCRDPERVLKQFDDFEYDFKNVVNNNKENDTVYYNKYPHDGEGAVHSDSIGMWRQYLNKELAKEIKNNFPFYNERFGYDD